MCVVYTTRQEYDEPLAKPKSRSIDDSNTSLSTKPPTKNKSFVGPTYIIQHTLTINITYIPRATVLGSVTQM